ncbi:MAG: adenosine deaminase [Selenomonadaceae bacterium]|nr:adenosine deaminase [Selenomonadaceae bacterium]
MAGNKNLNSAAREKNDEFYTQYDDIRREVNCYYLYDENFLRGKTVLLPCDDPEKSNFTKFFALNFKIYGLKKLIATSCAAQNSHGKIYTLEEKDLAKVDCTLKTLNHWEYLEGDGDFRSAEVSRLRDEADVIITNPPFSLFRDFFKWIVDAEKKFLVICNMNCVTYKEIFPLIMQNKIWLGNGFRNGDPCFTVPDDYEERSTRFWIDEHGQKWRSFGNLHWLTNLELAKRHEPMILMNYADCERLHPKIKGVGFQKYDNFDAIDVPARDAIPGDYNGVMGVPITFLDRYCPEQFEIIGKIDTGKINEYNLANPIINGKMKYKRLAIRRR